MNEKTQCSRAALLDAWTIHAWDNGVQIDTLGEMDSLTVLTQNNEYEITVICPQSGEVLIRGGRFFPELTPGRLSGSSLGGSFLKLGGIYTGFSMELQAGGQVIITSRVRSIRVIQKGKDRDIIRALSRRSPEN